MTKQLRTSLIAGFALAVTICVVGVVALDPPPPVETAAPTETATPNSTPAPSPSSVAEQPEPINTPRVDIENLGPDDVVAILWGESGCFSSRALDIRLSGARPGIAIVSELKFANGSWPQQVTRELDPSIVERSVEVPLSQSQAAGVTKWFEKLRQEPGRGCTSVVNLDILAISSNNGEVTEVREKLTDGTCSFTCDWTAIMQNALNPPAGIQTPAQPGTP